MDIQGSKHRALAANDWRTWNAQGMLATAISQQGRAGEAEPMLREALERMQLPTAQAYRREQLRAALVTTLRALGRTGEADRLSRDK